MHAISSASPSHVRIGPFRYDVVAWVVDEEGYFDALIIRDGEPVRYGMLPFHLDVEMVSGTASQAETAGPAA